MRALGSAVLLFEAVIVLLAIPMAVVVEGQPVVPTVVVGGLLMLVYALAPMTLRSPNGIYIGWALQVVFLATALFVPMALVLGLIFTLLWFASVRIGTRTDAIKAAQSAHQHHQYQ